ncbi:DNA mismatch repair protein Msh2-like [Palaemon carinicauda]|uniref:DNA mismatch repair protein Msh2-like n=1 Tax=Palaemon carinicauda TaxID=392227 RepID=UPI0035B5FCD6
MASLQPKEFALEGAGEQGFLSFLRNLPEKSNTTVRIFDRGEYFTVHGQDAVLAARELFHTNSVIKLLGAGENKVESVILSKLNFESFVRDLLLVKHYRLEVYKQKSGKNDWEADYKASPGNLSQFEEILFGGNSELNVTTGVMAVKLSSEGGQRIVGAGYVDAAGRVMTLSEFTDNDSFSNLEALIVQLGPKECLIAQGDLGPDGVKLKQVLSRSNMLLTERKKNEFSVKDADQDLNRLLRGVKDASSVAARPEFDRVVALAALTVVIKYLELLGDESNFGQFRLSQYDLSQYVRIDSAAVRALHIEPFGETHEMSGGSSKTHTILGLLDKCRTPLGHRLLAQWLRQPLIDINKIEERQDLVEALVSSVDLRHSLGEEHLKSIPDLHRLARKLTRKAATLQDCYRFYLCVQRLPNLCEAIAKYEGPHVTSLAAVFTTPLQELISDLTKFQEMIETTVDMEQAKLGEYVIKPDFDEKLGELRESMDQLEGDIQSQLRKAASDLGLEAGKSIKLESNAQLGYFFRVTLKEEKVLRNNRNYRMIDTNKAGVRFRNGAMQDLNDQHMSCREEYASQQKSVVDEILSIAGGYVEVIQHFGQIIATLDCVFALATAAVSAPIPYVRPKLLPKGSGVIKLKGIRHPCLELQDEISYIPNDSILSQDGGLFHIITGPNMGGKSTFLRSVGAAALMAQIGSFVACDEAEISILDSILARVGAGDCQLKGVSTFMAEMLETATILRSATKDSLIIIDELGRGTSTYDGFGLAWAISEYIAKEIGAFCLFATHFHELTSLEDEVDTVKNFHVSASTSHGALTLLYQVRPGPCDRSFGIHVAKLANFPDSVIEYAKRKAGELEDEFCGDDDDESEEAVKRRKLEKHEGEKLIETFLSKAAALHNEEIDDDKLQSEIGKLKQEVLSKNNGYISHLLSRET